jgi:uncharacterized phage protein (TIGR01671 family)
MPENLKFKAWDKRNKKWLPPERVAITGDGEISFLGNMFSKWEDNHPGLTNEDVKIVKFTGLHDKNEKEIYEGDIVKAMTGKVKLGEVKYYKDGFDIVALDDSDYNGVSLRSVGQNFIEVIGNIFEHPDLFKRSK